MRFSKKGSKFYWINFNNEITIGKRVYDHDDKCYYWIIIGCGYQIDDDRISILKAIN